MTALRVGSVVYLPSGSPPLTVLRVDEAIARVGWIDEHDVLHTGEFPHEALLPEEQTETKAKGRR